MVESIKDFEHNHEVDYVQRDSHSGQRLKAIILALRDPTLINVPKSLRGSPKPY